MSYSTSEGKPAISRHVSLAVICEACRRKTIQYLDVLLTENHIKCSHQQCGRDIDLERGETALILSKLAQACRDIRNESEVYRAFPADEQFDALRHPE